LTWSLYGLRTRGGRRARRRARKRVARHWAPFLVVLSLSWAGTAGARPEPAVNAPGIPPVTILNPDVSARLAVQHLSTADGKFGHHEYTQEDWPYIQFFSFYRTPEKLLPIHKKLLNVWVHQLSFEQQVSLPREVPGSQGRLVWVDIRNYGWNRPAVQAVAEREPYFQEPWVNHEHAEFLRRAAYARNSKKALRKKVFHAQGVMRGDWFMRETGESDRSPSYYDLLFARFRFPKGQRSRPGRGGCGFRNTSRRMNTGQAAWTHGTASITVPGTIKLRGCVTSGWIASWTGKTTPSWTSRKTSGSGSRRSAWTR
jgi:hypothetical protein